MNYMLLSVDVTVMVENKNMKKCFYDCGRMGDFRLIVGEFAGEYCCFQCEQEALDRFRAKTPKEKEEIMDRVARDLNREGLVDIQTETERE